MDAVVFIDKWNINVYKIYKRIVVFVEYTYIVNLTLRLTIIIKRVHFRRGAPLRIYDQDAVIRWPASVVSPILVHTYTNKTRIKYSAISERKGRPHRVARNYSNTLFFHLNILSHH